METTMSLLEQKQTILSSFVSSRWFSGISSILLLNVSINLWWVRCVWAIRIQWEEILTVCIYLLNIQSNDIRNTSNDFYSLSSDVFILWITCRYIYGTRWFDVTKIGNRYTYLKLDYSYREYQYSSFDKVYQIKRSYTLQYIGITYFCNMIFQHDCGVCISSSLKIWVTLNGTPILLQKSLLTR